MINSSKAGNSDRPVLLFDGTCIMCNFFFQWVLNKDKTGMFRFATLQSETGKQFIKNQVMDFNEDTVLLHYRNELFTYSTAALRTLILLGGMSKLAGYSGLIFPKSLRDFVYRFIAKNRYRWFGTKECLIPTVELKDRFL